MKEDPPAGAKCKDKFLVQSAIISSDKEVLSLAEVVRHFLSILWSQYARGKRLTRSCVCFNVGIVQWSSIEKEDRGSIHEQKIRCAYTEAGDEDGHTGIVDDADRSILVDGTVRSSPSFSHPSDPSS
jgi:hypothetical protein